LKESEDILPKAPEEEENKLKTLKNERKSSRGKKKTQDPLDGIQTTTSMFFLIVVS